ncbi:MAG: sigma-70 family RNA polymerase sigma factor [Cyclobacteriaceae bacterium]
MLALEELSTCTRETAITKWYEEVFPLAAAYIQRRGGNLEEAKELFQEAIVLYYEKLMSGDVRHEVEDGAYLMGIVKKRWLKHRKQFGGNESLEHIDVTEERVQEPLTQKLLHYLKQSGERCMDLLQSFYYEKLTMKQMADRYGYTSERSATVQKYKCLEKVRDEIKQKSLSYEDFLD